MVATTAADGRQVVDAARKAGARVRRTSSPDASLYKEGKRS
jgi:hypothetical protein